MLFRKGLARWERVLNVKVILNFHSRCELTQDANNIPYSILVIAVVWRKVLKYVIKPYSVDLESLV